SDNSFVFEVCDGVGQSFYGDLASRLLGELLSDWLSSLVVSSTPSVSELRAALAMFLGEATVKATAAVDAMPLPSDTPPILEEVLNDKRKSGSESTFVCGRIDL